MPWDTFVHNSDFAAGESAKVLFCQLDIAMQTRNNSGVKNGGISLRAENFYAVWRERCRAVNLLRDGGSIPPEKLLQAVWQHQRLRRDKLKTADGKSVRVLHPGFASAEADRTFAVRCYNLKMLRQCLAM